MQTLNLESYESLRDRVRRVVNGNKDKTATQIVAAITASFPGVDFIVLGKIIDEIILEQNP